MQQQIQLPKDIHLLKYKNGMYLGSSGCDLRPRSTIFGFQNKTSAKRIQQHIHDTKVYNVYFHPKRPYEYLLKPHNANALKQKPFDFQNVTVVEYDSEELLQYIGRNNVDLSIVDDVQNVKNNHMRLFVTYIFQPDLNTHSVIEYLEDTYHTANDEDVLL